MFGFYLWKDNLNLVSEIFPFISYTQTVHDFFNVYSGRLTNTKRNRVYGCNRMTENIFVSLWKQFQYMVFIYMHNVYKHAEAQISKKLNIV